MIQFDIITIFPDAFKSYFSQSIIKRALKKKLIKINIWNLRDFCGDKHKTVDDKPYGGGAGMILKVEPIYKAVRFLMSKAKNQKPKIILFGARGKKFDQKMAKRLSKSERLIMICGHYEGVDERVACNIADVEISIGDYILTGGELPSMVVLDCLTRLVPGVIKKESLKEESFSSGKSYLEYPQYTRPQVLKIKNKKNYIKKLSKKKILCVPDVLLSGNHKKIKEWREKKSLELDRKRNKC